MSSYLRRCKTATTFDRQLYDRNESRPSSVCQKMEEEGYNNYYQRILSSNGNNAAFEEVIDLKPVTANNNRSYYYPSNPPLFRSGRLGSPWRHIRQTTGNLGNNILFIDGTVKTRDLSRFPPYGLAEPTNQYNSINSPKKIRYTCRPKVLKKYWYEDKPPASYYTPKRTIVGNFHRMTTGY